MELNIQDKKIKKLRLIVDIGLLILIEMFILSFFDVNMIFRDTVLNGGDTCSYHQGADYLQNELLPNGMLKGNEPGNFAGYPIFQFYFIVPFLASALLGYVIPLTVSLKIITLSGIFLFPLFVYLGFKKFKYSFPIPIIATIFSLFFLYNQGYTMFGGNIASTFAGEFCYMISIAIFCYYIGALYSMVKERKGIILAGMLLGLIGLTHSFVFFCAVLVPVFFIFQKEDSKDEYKTKLKHILQVYLIGFLIMAFWVLPMVFNYKYATPYYLIWVFANIQELYYPYIIPFLIIFIVRIIFEIISKTSYKKYNKLGDELAKLEEAKKNLESRINPDLSKNEKKDIEEELQELNETIENKKLKLEGSKDNYTFGLKDPKDNKQTFYLFAYTMILGLLLYLNGHLLSVPDIRFIPFICLMAVFTGANFLDLFIHYIDQYKGFSQIKSNLAKSGIAVILFIFTGLVLTTSANIARDWFRWNYKGWENYEGYDALKKLSYHLSDKSIPWEKFRNYNKHIKGRYDLPRVGYEKNKFVHSDFGSDRAFESIAFFTGRATLEGVHYTSGLSAKFMAFMEIEFSKEIMIPIGYLFPRINLEGIKKHFKMFNVNQLILTRGKDEPDSYLKQILDKDKEFIKEFEVKSNSQVTYYVYRFTGGADRYIEIPDVKPVLYSGDKWKDDFFTWFKHLDTLDVNLVPAEYVTDNDKKYFKNGIGKIVGDSGKIIGLEKFQKDNVFDKPVSAKEKLSYVKEEISPFRIKFTTNQVGKPHIIKFAYFPNWKVDGADAIYPVSPCFMMVIPNKKEVTLTYSYTTLDWITVFLTVFGIIAVIYFSIRKKEPFEFLGKAPFSYLFGFIYNFRKYILLGLIFVVLLATVYSLINRDKATKVYHKGLKYYDLAQQQKPLMGQVAQLEVFSKTVALFNTKEKIDIARQNFDRLAKIDDVRIGLKEVRGFLDEYLNNIGKNKDYQNYKAAHQRLREKLDYLINYNISQEQLIVAYSFFDKIENLLLNYINFKDKLAEAMQYFESASSIINGSLSNEEQKSITYSRQFADITSVLDTVKIFDNAEKAYPGFIERYLSDKDNFVKELQTEAEENSNKAEEYLKTICMDEELDSGYIYHANMLLFRLYLTMNKPMEAVGLLKSYIKREYNSRDISQIYFELGNVYNYNSTMKNIEEAKNYYKKAVEMEPYSSYSNEAKIKLDEIEKATLEADKQNKELKK